MNPTPNAAANEATRSSCDRSLEVILIDALASQETYSMQSIEPLRSDPNHLSKSKFVPSAARHAKSRNRLAQPAHRFNVDCWLSHADANLLLQKRARCEASQGNYAAALEIFNQLIVREPENPNNFVNRGLMYSNLQRYDEALASYNWAIELNPELSKAYSNRANLHATCQNWRDAIADYDQAIDLNPLNIFARLNQAVTFRDIGDYEEALVCLDIALFFRPKSATLYSERGRTYHLQGSWNQAIADYTTAHRLAEDTSLKDISSPERVIRRVQGWIDSLNSI